MLQFINPARLGWAVGIIVLTLLLRFLQKLYFQRTLMKGLPGPPHSFLWGSLKSMGEVISHQPKHAAPQTYALPIRDRYKLGDYFYMDPWPFGDPLLVVLNADMMHEVAVERNLPKHPVIEEFLKHLGGPGGLVSSEGKTWKKWRSVFNPGFSSQHLMTLVPLIVDQCSVFGDIMAEHAAKDDLFRMEQATTKLTIDIIGKVVLDLSFNAQRGSNELVDTFINQVKWLPIGAQFRPSEMIDIRRPFILAWNTWKMNRYINRELDERFASRGSRGKTKTIVDLALEAYLKEVKGSGAASAATTTTLDADFKRAAISNLKTFIFAGHDTTSSTICYAYYYLSKHPEKMARARAELDTVFGPDQSTVHNQLKETPHLLNRLDYTLAITREVLRLQPPASTVRKGVKGVFLRDPATGERIPTEHFMIWPVDVGLGRNERYWAPDPHSFRPERFLDSPSAGNPTTWNPDAWIPFSKGPRNCIGQELAILETKAILALTLRRFDVIPAFDELEKLRGDASGYPSDVGGVQSQYGEEAYQIQLGTAKPREGMPCRVRVRE